MHDVRSQSRRGLDRRGIVAFLLLVFGSTWTLEIGALAMGMRFHPLGSGGVLLLTVAMFCPALSAFVVRRFITREGFATAGLRLGAARLYVAVWLGVPLSFALIYGLTVVLGVGELDLAMRGFYALVPPALTAKKPLPPPGTLAPLIFASTLTIPLLVTSVATFGEEFGWTGYLFPKLLPLGRFEAALIYGPIWGLWHAPAIWAGYNYPGHPYLGIVMMCLFTTALALSQAALRLRSNSVLLTSLFHASINVQARGVLPLLVTGVAPLLGGPLGVVGIVVFALAGALLLSRTPAPDATQAGAPT